jgi:hypothetical protein
MRALVLSGGGAKGAYQVGATTNLLENPLDFRTAEIRLNMQRGYDDAKRARWD